MGIPVAFQSADRLMQRALEENVFPGAALLAVKDSRVAFWRNYGVANLFTRQVIDDDTCFDLASLTKPLATTLAVLILIEHGAFTLDHALGDLLPAFRQTSKAQISVRQLLGHNAGLPAHRPFYHRLVKQPPVLRKSCLRELLVSLLPLKPAGGKAIYSDIGFMILEWVVEKTSAQSFDSFVAHEIYKALGIGDLFFLGVDQKPCAHFAATEICAWRSCLMNGTVHDENAYALGGVAGHAGLFGTMKAVKRLLQGVLSAYSAVKSPRLFSPKLLKEVFARQPSTGRALGFDSPDSIKSSSGRYFHANSVGHLGFTGTSFWIDLDREWIVILLTNRVHPSRYNSKITVFRPMIHDTVMQGLMKFKN